MSGSLAFEVHLKASYEEALEKVGVALKTEGFGILTKVDVRSTMREKLNQEFRPYAILGTCNPPLAYRALSHDGRAGLLLPCNVTVEADPEGGTLVRIGDPYVLLSMGGLDRDPVLKEIATEAREKLRRAADALERLEGR